MPRLKCPNGLMVDVGRVQLFKAQDGKYLLDLHRVEGPSFLFLDLCALFLVEIGAV